MKDILVIGDSCRDVFIYCEANRLAPDVPVPVLNIINQTENPGMAKNVQRNILTKIKDCDIITNEGWYNVTKTRYVHEKTNHTFFRVDSSNTVPKIDLTKLNYNYKIIVISDYDKGFLTEDDIETICKNHTNVFIDTKKIVGPFMKDAKYIKINDNEYNKSKDSINKLGLEKKLIHTMGGEGCKFKNKIYKVNKVDVKDTSGAGDSFLAGLVIEYLNSEDIESSINYANLCASEVVKHVGVTTI